MDIDEVEGTPAPQSQEWPEDFSPSPGRIAQLDELATRLVRRRAEEKEARKSKLCWQMRNKKGRKPRPDAI